MSKIMIMKKSFLLAYVLFFLNFSIIPSQAQIPGLTEGLIAGMAAAAAANSKPNKPVRGIGWSQDIYTSHMCLSLKKSSGGVTVKNEQRGFSVSTKKIIWVGESQFVSSPRPLKAVWTSPDGKTRETPVVRYYKEVYKADLFNKKDLLSANEGRWQVSILTDRGQEVDRQDFYVGHADVQKESQPVKDAPGALNLSQEDAVIISSKREVVVYDQFGSLERLTQRAMVLTDKGKELVEISLPYVDGVDDITVNYAYTIKPDGKVVDATEYGSQTFAKSFPDYTAFKFFSMTMPSLEKGSIIEFQLLISSPRPKVEGIFCDTYSPRGVLPVLESSYVLNIPEEVNLQYALLNINVDVKKFDQGVGRKVYKFLASPGPSIKIEPSMPPRREVAGEVIITTAKSWDDIAGWWHNLIKDKSSVTPDIQAHVDQLVKGTASNKEKIRKIFADVTDNIRYVGYNFGYTVYEPADAAFVFKNKYGDCKDQTILLLAMLKAAGIKAHTALALSGLGLRTQKETPTVGEFNHVIAVAQDENAEYFLDPTLKKYPFGVLPPWLENRYLMHVKEGVASFELLPLTQSQVNTTTTDINFEFDKDLNIIGNMKIEWRGQSNGNMRQYLYNLESEKQRDQFVDNALKGIYSYASRDSYQFNTDDSVDVPIVLQIKFHMDHWLLDAGGGNYLLHMYGGEVEVPDFLGKNRMYPVRIDSLTKQILRVVVRIPDNFDVDLPAPFNLSDSYVGNYVRYTYKDHLLQLEQELDYPKTDIPLDQINSARKTWESISQANRKGVLLKPRGQGLLGK